MINKTDVFKRIFFALFFVFALHAHAYSATLEDGRILLFNSGEGPTLSNIQEANNIFKVILKDDPDNEEANLFYAITRIAVMALIKGPDNNITTFRDLAEAGGLVRNSVDVLQEDSFPYDIPEIDGHYDTSHINVTGEEISAFLAGPFIDTIDAAISNLDKIKPDFNTILKKQETGLDDVEFDYGEVLVLKAGLYYFKVSLLFLTSYNLDLSKEKLKEIADIALELIDPPSIQTALSSNPDLLKLRKDSGVKQLQDAKESLITGINISENAIKFITSEIDVQENDLIFFESSEDIKLAKEFIEDLKRLKNSLYENVPFTFVAEGNNDSQNWLLIDQNGLNMSIYDYGDHAYGWFYSYNNNNNMNSPCSSYYRHCEIEEFNVDKESNRFNMTVEEREYYSSPSKTIKYSGELAGDKILNGRYEYFYDEYNTYYGSFWGMCTDEEPEEIIFDLNRIFGNKNKKPLDIRYETPKFDTNDKIIPMTYPPDSILIGLLDSEYHISSWKTDYNSSNTVVSFSIRNQFGEYLRINNTKEIIVKKENSDEIIPVEFSFNKMNLITGEFNENTNIWDDIENTEASVFSAVLDEDLQSGIYEITVIDKDDNSLTQKVEYPAFSLLNLPLLSSRTFSNIWIDNKISCQWVLPNSGFSDLNYVPIVRILEGDFLTGEFSTEVGMDTNQIFITANLIESLRRSGNKFEFGICSQKTNTMFRKCSNFIPIDINNIEKGVVSGKALFNFNGKLIPLTGALVSVNGTELKTTTNEDGIYIFPSVPKGEYSLTISDSYFETLIVENVCVSGYGLKTTIPHLELQLSDSVDIDQLIKQELEKFDVSLDGRIDIKEAIRALQISSGMVQ